MAKLKFNVQCQDLKEVKRFMNATKNLVKTIDKKRWFDKWNNENLNETKEYIELKEALSMGNHEVDEKRYPLMPPPPAISAKRLPLVVKLSTVIKETDYEKRLSELKEQYGGPVVLLKHGEEQAN